MRNATKTAICLALALVFALTLLVACDNQTQTDNYTTGGTVAVSGGKISGKLNDDGSVAIYKGVPYAAAPVGQLRFKAPQDVEPWDGVKDCTLWGANAIQGKISTFSYWTKEFIQDTDPSHYQGGKVYSEDCLTLNVWSSTATTANKPVLVYIHGGGYNSGGASCPVYDGEHIAQKDVVFVSIQYRVGVLGYLATDALVDEHDGAGNFGLLDQIKALQWVQDNIATFGGDCDNVTVMGQSAGGGSVNALMASPLTKGLFSAAVSASHNSINQDWQTLSQRANNAPAALKNKTAQQLREMDAEQFNSYSIADNGPVVDDTTLTDTYRKSILNNTLADVPLMSGMVAQDNLIYSVYTTNTISAVDTMMTLQNNIVTAKKYANYTSDTFLYLFNQKVPQDSLKTSNAYGAKHSYELAYFFGNFVDNRDWSDNDRDLSTRMMTHLVNFCYYANPNLEGQNFWKASTGNYSYMELNEVPQIRYVAPSAYNQVNNYYKLELVK